MAQARTEPPSEQRIAEAKHQGHVPRTTMVGALLSFAALSASLIFAGERFETALRVLYAMPLEALRSGKELSPAAWLLRVTSQWIPLVVLLLLSVLFVIVAGLLLVQGPVFRLTHADMRTDFGKLESTRKVAFLLTSGAVMTVLGLSIFEALSATPRDFLQIVARVLLRLSIACVLVAIIEAAFARASFFRSLWLTRTQKREEEREAYGSPELRAARERARRELGMSATRRAP